MNYISSRKMTAEYNVITVASIPACPAHIGQGKIVVCQGDPAY